jgi:CHAT domain-containing protein/tetratricopeptide (TPR) repeat protein
MIVDLQERADLVPSLSAGTLNQSVCPHCGETYTWNAPLLVYQPATPWPDIVFSPAEGSTDEQNQQHLTGLLEVLIARLGPECAIAGSEHIRIVPHKRLRYGHSNVGSGQNESQQVQAGRQNLEKVSREHDPVRWAQLQIQLGDAYLDNPTGPRAENIDEAIAAYRRALEVLSPESQPQGWAVALNQLGGAYLERIVGSRSENMEQAVQAFRDAARVFTRGQAPEAWATLMMNIANAYAQAVGAGRAERVEQAISLYEQVLEVRTREANPRLWAQATYNLATAYQNRIRGSRQENLEHAISLYGALAEVRTRENDPNQWATTQMALGNAFADRISGDRAANLDRAIAAYDRALEIITRNQAPYQWATIQANRGSAHERRISGDPVANLEQAIKAMEQALAVLEGHETAENMTNLLTNLAGAYLRRTRQDRAENVERAFSLCRQALRFVSPEHLPFAWGTAMEMLADIYEHRTVGGRAENVERAIATREEVLRVVHRDDAPRSYANNLLGLSALYRKRLSGDRADNIERAIDASQQALRVFAAEAQSRTSTAGLQTLANAYLDRVVGDHSENLEQAIGLLERVLEARTRAGDRLGRANAAVSLGSAYLQRIRGNRPDNLRRAAELYQEVLKVRSREAFPVEWAAITHGLALVCMDLGAVDQPGAAVAHVEQAIALYHEVLSVRTRDSMPYEWAQTMHNLTQAYRARADGRAMDLESAIATEAQALEVLRPESFPADCLVAARSLGDLYFDQQRWSDAAAAYENALDASARLYKASLFLRTKEAELVAKRNLHHLAAFALAKAGRLENAITVLEQGRAIWLDEALARDSAELQSLAEAAPEAYAQYSEAAARLQQLEAAERKTTAAEEEAVTLSPVLREEAARAQQAVDAAIQRMTKSIPKTGDDQEWVMVDIKSMKELDPAGYADYSAAMARLSQIEAAGRTPYSLRAEGTPPSLREDLVRAWRELNEAVESIRRIPGHEDFLSKPEFSRIARSVGPHSSLVYLMTVPAGSLALVVTPDAAAPVQAVWADSLTSASLDELLVKRGPNVGHPGYLSALDSLSITPQFLEHSLSEILPFLGAHLMGPVAACLRRPGITAATLFPGGVLHLLPLHAAAYLADGQERCFFEEVDVSYAPSIRALEVAQAATEALAKRTPSLIGVGNPLPHSHPLPYARAELEKVAACFASSERHKLVGEQATVDAFLTLSGATHVHLACHGAFRPHQPLDSQLQFAGGVPLTLRQILDENCFRGVRLVTLSACETGISDFARVPDEALGMPAGLLRAGAAGVVASLWAISDLSTMLLMERFYRELLTPQPAAFALRRAQCWLRDLSADQLAARFDSERRSGDMQYEEASQAWRRFSSMPPEHRPFASPFYWAAYTFTGA